MPTVIALDVSLSMSRPVTGTECPEEYQRRNLAIHGINTLLDFMSTNCRLELTSLVVFSYLWEQLVGFTRDFESIKAALNKVEEYNVTSIESALTGISSVINDQWSSITPCQAVLITDGSTGAGHRSLQTLLHNWSKHEGSGTSGDEKFPLPFPFSCKLNVVIVGNPNDAEVKSAIPMFEKLVEINGQGGEVIVPENSLGLKSVQTVFEQLAERCYSPYQGSLQCGHFKCPVHLYPAPDPYRKNHDFELIDTEIGDTLDILGFLDIADAASPQTLSRHLVFPISSKDNKTDEANKDIKTEDEDETATGHDDGKVPAFTVLLHGSLKVEGMVALTKVGPDWYGLLYSWADSKKKSNLMLSLLEPGQEPINWLGPINNLAPISDFPDPPYGEDDNKTPFPVRPLDKRSYAQSCVVWIKPSGLQSDLQKVLRHARKLPEKQQQFYKELNRLRRAALGFGFHELLEGMATMLERECTMLPGTAHPDAALQLTHAANALRSETATDIAQMVMPLRTNFSQDD